MLTAAEIRQGFIDFFVQHDHRFVPSAPVVPTDDPTLMFTNAGMNQFKDVFLGTGQRDYRRAANSQKCIRVSGKHNDLEEVGRDNYHHTFFEMLGNWSFGDYFKREAIEWGWELLTGVWKLPADRLYPTIFAGSPQDGVPADEEAFEYWAPIVGADRVQRFGKKDNFWEMGETGPCGPCSEIHIDLTKGGDGLKLVNAGRPEVIELWNLVFIEFNRSAVGALTPLPAKHVDTGMGFERLVRVLQGAKGNYETDVFGPIIAHIAELTGRKYTGRLGAGAEVDNAFRVVADHLRMLAFSITDGALPGNEGRGYVLRRLVRRAARFGRQHLGQHEPFIYKLVPTLVETMGRAYPEVLESAHRVADILRDEESSFGKTLDRGIALFEEAYERSLDSRKTPAKPRHGKPQHASVTKTADGKRTLGVFDQMGSQGQVNLQIDLPVPANAIPRIYAETPKISGKDAFRLYDTFGFPIDLTVQMAEERGLEVDTEDYQRLVQEARHIARAGSKASDTSHIKQAQELRKQQPGDTDDSVKYTGLECDTRMTSFARMTAPFDTDSAKTGQDIVFTLAETCFYAEEGGQVSDTGVVTTATGKIEVTFVRRVGDVIVHSGRVIQGEIRPGASCRARVAKARFSTMRNHTATHILNWALREVLEFGGAGKVDQKGSWVDPEKTRFDFSHAKPLTPQEIERIETLCNERIQADQPLYKKEVPEREARKINTLRAVFGEKYPDVVRVVSIGMDIDTMLRDPQNPEWMKYAVEFCGGTHVSRTSEIGAFVLTAQGSVAKGIRRVVGITGEKARRAIDAAKHLLEWARSVKEGPPSRVAEALANLREDLANSEIPLRDRIVLRKTIAELQEIVRKQADLLAAESSRGLRAARQDLLENAEPIEGHAVIVAEVPMVPVEQLRETADWLRSRAGSAAVLLIANDCDAQRVLILAALTKDLVARGLHAGKWVGQVAPVVGGRGGGKPDLAQAGGKDPASVAAALEAGRAWVRSALGGAG